MKLTKDIGAGLLFLCIGSGAVLVARGYPLGSAMRMGPGYFPILLGILIATGGAVLLIRGLLAAREGRAHVGRIALRPLLLVMASILAFGFLIDRWGLIVSVGALIVLGRLAGREGSPVELLIMLAVLIGMAIGLFIYVLNMPLLMLPI